MIINGKTGDKVKYNGTVEYLRRYWNETGTIEKYTPTQVAVDYWSGATLYFHPNELDLVDENGKAINHPELQTILTAFDEIEVKHLTDEQLKWVGSVANNIALDVEHEQYKRGWDIH